MVWTHKVLPGGTDRSYGIQVAKMAGVPPRVLQRAGEILGTLEDREASPSAVSPTTKNVQMTLFDVEEPGQLKELRAMDVDQMTPMEALLKLSEWKRQL